MFKKILFFIIIIGFVLTPVLVVNAQYGIDVTAKQTGITSISIPTFLGSILGGVLSMVGIAFFALVLYGGVTWMTASGNQEKQKKAFGTIVAASIGVVIVLSSYVLVNFVFSGIGGGGNASGGGGTQATSTEPKKGTCVAIGEKTMKKSCEYKSEAEPTIACANFKLSGEEPCEGNPGLCTFKMKDSNFCKVLEKKKCEDFEEYCEWK